MKKDVKGLYGLSYLSSDHGTAHMADPQQISHGSDDKVDMKHKTTA